VEGSSSANPQQKARGPRADSYEQDFFVGFGGSVFTGSIAIQYPDFTPEPETALLIDVQEDDIFTHLKLAVTPLLIESEHSPADEIADVKASVSSHKFLPFCHYQRDVDCKL
jgi:hypothetical protein